MPDAKIDAPPLRAAASSRSRCEGSYPNGLISVVDVVVTTLIPAARIRS